jgi:glycosyltransferase involved in cell wall biosynthesis
MMPLSGTTARRGAPGVNPEDSERASVGSAEDALDDQGCARPLVSVIVPVWNAERFLEETIESVRSQTYSHWEVLLVDDGSTDGSAAICKRYAGMEPVRIRLLQHPGGVNRGRCPTRNLGISEARGELIAFLDADDVYLPKKLERQVEILLRTPDAAMVYGPTTYWYGWSGRPEDAARDRRPRLGVRAGSLVPPRALPSLWVRRRGHAPPPCAALVRRNVVNEVGGFDESFRELFEDQAFFHKIALRHAVYVDDASYDLYRQHPGSTCSIDKQNRRRAGRHASDTHYLAFLAWLEGHVRDERLGDAALLRAVRVERWLQHHRQMARLVRRARRLARAGMQRMARSTR